MTTDQLATEIEAVINRATRSSDPQISICYCPACTEAIAREIAEYVLAEWDTLSQ